MPSNRIGFVWKMLPPWFRQKLVRATQTKFTVSAAAMISNPEGKVLLLNHVLRPYSGWGLPGGFISRGEQPEDAVRREIREETGLELDDVKLFRFRTIGQHVETLFTARASGEAKVMSPREIIELGWFTVDDLPRDMSRVQKELIREWIERR